MTTEAGGRSKAARSGYRPQFYYNGMDWDAEHRYPDVEEVLPGDTVKVHLRFVSPHEHYGRISEGMPFLIREGTRTVAFGIVTEIFDQLASDAAEFG